MPQLKKWHVVTRGAKYILKGTVYGHPKQDKCPDGMFVHTSAIDTAQLEKYGILVKTLSGTVYECYFENLNIAEHEEDYEAFAEQFFGARASEMISARDRQRELWKNFISEKTERLEDGEVYICLSVHAPYYFDTAFTKSGTLTHSLHVGMFQDSVLINDCSFCYFPYKDNNVEFYNAFYFPDDIEGMNDVMDIDCRESFGYLKNTGTLPLHIHLYGKTIDLQPDEELPLTKQGITEHDFGEMTSLKDLGTPQSYYMRGGDATANAARETMEQLHLALYNAKTKEEAQEIRERWMSEHGNIAGTGISEDGENKCQEE